MKIQLFILVYVFTLSLIFCQEQEKVNIEKALNNQLEYGASAENEIIDTMIKEVLKSQLKDGNSVPLGDEYESHDYSEKDLEATISIIENILVSQGYKIPTQSEFKEKIQEGFGVDIDKTKEDIIILYYNDRYNVLNDYVYGNTYNFCMSNLFIDKKRRIITPMIFLSDLIKIKNFETQDYDILQDLKVLSLNKLVIYEDKASLTYLQSKEPEFTSELLINFGYDKSDILNNFVIDNIYHKNLNNFLNEVVFFKNNKGELKIREKALQSVKKRYLRDKNINNIMPLRYFSSQVILNNEKTYTDEEQMKIIGYLSNIYDPIYKEDHYNSNWDWGVSDILSDYLYSVSNEEWKITKKYYEKNHYFGLSYLKEMIAYAEQFDEKIGPPDNY